MFLFNEYPILYLNDFALGLCPNSPITFLSSCPTDLAGGDTKKSNQKKSRLSPLRSKNLRLTASRGLGINSPPAQTKKIFYAVITCFSAHRPKPVAVLSFLGMKTVIQIKFYSSYSRLNPNLFRTFASFVS